MRGYFKLQFHEIMNFSPPNFQIAAKHGITPLAVVIRWTLHHGVSAIPRSGNAEHIRENCREIALAQQKGEAEEQRCILVLLPVFIVQVVLFATLLPVLKLFYLQRSHRHQGAASPGGRGSTGRPARGAPLLLEPVAVAGAGGQGQGAVNYIVAEALFYQMTPWSTYASSEWHSALQ